MSVKIKISYTDDEELPGVIQLLSPVLRSYKAKKGIKGGHRNAYAFVDGSKLMKFIQGEHRSTSEVRERPDSG